MVRVKQLVHNVDCILLFVTHRFSYVIVVWLLSNWDCCIKNVVHIVYSYLNHDKSFTVICTSNMCTCILYVRTQ